MRSASKKMWLAGLAVLLLCQWAPGRAAAEGQRVGFNSATGNIDFTYGNAQLAYGESGELTGIRHLTLNALWNNAADAVVTGKKGHATVEHVWGEGSAKAELETTVARKYDGTLTISQYAESAAEGITGIQWGLIVPDTHDLILPVLGGIRLTAESPDAAYGFRQFAYPDVWEAQMLLIQGDGGGMLVHANDDAMFFKTLHVKHENGYFHIGLETHTPAPFQQTKTAASTDWRLKAYAGDWTNGALMYRDWADQTFRLSELSALEPAWANDIRFTVLTDLEDPDMLDQLAQKVQADQTLLVVPGWREDPYDVNFPNYAPKADMANKVQEAQALGFKVMLYVNIFGVSFDNPAYAALQAYQVKDPYTLTPKKWEYSAGSEQIAFAVINPAAEAWREMFVDKMADLVDEVGPDAIHLDQSLLMYNDANGLIDGKNMMQGNLALHRELRQALPAHIALGGESLNEITTRYESFAQRHAYGIFSGTGTWDNSKIDQVVPASSAIFAPYTTIYGHPDHANPMTEDYYMAWHKVVQNRLGAVPMLSRPNYGQVANPTPLMEQLFAEANWYQDARPEASFTGWTGNTLFAFRTEDGKTAQYVRDSFGEKLHVRSSGFPWQGTNVVRYLYGSEAYELSGTIPGWRLYDATRLYGLNPGQTYLYNGEPRDLNAFHIYDWPENVSLKQLALRTNHAVIRMEDLLQASEINLLNYAGPIRAGETMGDDTVHQTDTSFSSTNGFSFSFAGGGTVQHWGDRMLAHPPYIGQWQDGHTWLEFDVDIPADVAASFQVGVQLGSEQNVLHSDGVTFKALAWEKEAAPGTRVVLSEEQFSRSATAAPMELDLSSFAGTTVTVRLETHPGATVDNDSAVWVEPRVVLEPNGEQARMVELKFVSPQAVAEIKSVSGQAGLSDLGNGKFVITAPASDTVYLIYDALTPATLPLSLDSAPFDTSLWFDNGMEGLAQAPFGGFAGTGSVNNVNKQGLDAHPPQRGQTHVEYALRLPVGTDAALTGFAGIKDGADESGGVGFRIAVNGNIVWSEDMMPGAAWEPFHISLADYAGESVVLTLITDSMGDYGYDWAFWGEPQLIAD
ncbi:DUF6259 domain-containing protein [Paenibacillus sp. PAMC21692]|uniref:DUF6259 domain-containing protein n=1 Tax=Paenibacillus sp. PAMC21692 TaxID=2762320 RepID=UPI00164D154C|nr:DUF6259 domain-containing protein [Paenibacillus sp. PAMC21692]QNK57689.1 NPCBM/NEW2 domain-containing protein [Paenibacillus sp. PAMC21692]